MNERSVVPSRPIPAEPFSSLADAARDRRGVLLISLDFELHWGVRDQKTVDDYRDNLLGVREAVPALLNTFSEYGIHATWATVGFLFFENREQLLRGLPVQRPQYANRALNPYEHLHEIGENEEQDPFHYAPSLIKRIASTPNQEIGTHTFSHYYCLERGHDLETFKDDLRAAIRAAEALRVRLHSIVFPRNQTNRAYLEACAELGIRAYRGTVASRAWAASDEEGESLPRRGTRLLDAYLRIAGDHSYPLRATAAARPYNMPASNFLRPYSRRLSPLEPLRLRRITRDLASAARRGGVYHLWWHPHNFGTHLEENLAFLRAILEQFRTHERTYGMRSMNMGELARELSERDRA
jgi:peptidoglycan/xylan/chitin deacetylase (PgdA/CDA1 family)